MATERETMTLNGVPGSVLGDEERSDEAPSTGADTPHPAPDPEVVAKPKRRQFTACQRRSKSTPLAGVKMHHLMRFSPALAVVPVVHRRDARCFV